MQNLDIQYIKHHATPFCLHWYLHIGKGFVLANNVAKFLMFEQSDQSPHQVYNDNIVFFAVSLQLTALSTMIIDISSNSRRGFAGLEVYHGELQQM